MNNPRKLISLVSIGGFLIGIALAQGACVPCSAMQCPETLPGPQVGQFSVNHIEDFDSWDRLYWEESSWQDVSEGTIEVTADQVSFIYALASGVEVTATFDVMSKDEIYDR